MPWACASGASGSTKQATQAGPLATATLRVTGLPAATSCDSRRAIVSPSAGSPGAYCPVVRTTTRGGQPGGLIRDELDHTVPSAPPARGPDPVADRHGPARHPARDTGRDGRAAAPRIDRTNLDSCLRRADRDHGTALVVIDTAGTAMLPVRPAHHRIGGMIRPDPAKPDLVVHPVSGQAADRFRLPDLSAGSDHREVVSGGQRRYVVPSGGRRNGKTSRPSVPWRGIPAIGGTAAASPAWMQAPATAAACRSAPAGPGRKAAASIRLRMRRYRQPAPLPPGRRWAGVPVLAPP